MIHIIRIIHDIIDTWPIAYCILPLAYWLLPIVLLPRCGRRLHIDIYPIAVAIREGGYVDPYTTRAYRIAVGPL